MDEKIIVTLTTWKNRINNIEHIINSVMNNTKKPDKIVLNLANEDFPDKEKNFPDSLVSKISEVGIVELNWICNNTKVWKKLIPTLVKYPEDIVISIDDDFEYPNDLIETLYNDYIKNGKKYPISGNHEKVCGVRAHCGCASLTSYRFLNGNGQFKYLTQDILDMGSDDVFYTWCAKINNTEYVSSSKLFFVNLKSYNAVNPYSKSNNVDKNISSEYKKLDNNYKNNIISDIVSYICGEKKYESKGSIQIKQTTTSSTNNTSVNLKTTNNTSQTTSLTKNGKPKRTMSNPPRPHSLVFKRLYRTY